MRKRIYVFVQHARARQGKYACSSAYVCVCVCVLASLVPTGVYVCACVCVSECVRERERERGGVDYERAAYARGVVVISIFIVSSSDELNFLWRHQPSQMQHPAYFSFMACRCVLGLLRTA